MEDNYKKSSPHTDLFAKMLRKCEDMARPRSQILSWTVVILNICFLAIAWIIVAHRGDVAGFDDVIGLINWKYMWLIMSIVLIIVLMRGFVDCFLIYVKCKKRRFLATFFANNKLNFYNSVTFWSNGGYNVYVQRLISGGVPVQATIDTQATKRFVGLVSIIAYSLIALIIGMCTCFDRINLGFFICGLLVLVGVSVGFVFIVCLIINRERALNFTGKLCRLLFKLKLIKNFDMTYKNIANQLFVWEHNSKTHKGMIVLQVIFNMVIQFLRHFILYIILTMINAGGVDILIEVLFKCTIMDLIFAILPMPRGTAIYEILFLGLFMNTFVSGYVLWGMMLYRFFDYFVYVVLYMLSLLDLKKRQIKKIPSEN